MTPRTRLARSHTKGQAHSAQGTGDENQVPLGASTIANTRVTSTVVARRVIPETQSQPGGSVSVRCQTSLEPP